jgi:hypothetical protein
MSRKVILTLAAAATLAAASLGESSAGYARNFRSSSGGSANHFARISHSPRLHESSDPGRHIGLHEHHRHWAFRNGVWVEVDDVVADAVDVTPTTVHLPDQKLYADRSRGVRRHLHQGIGQRTSRQRR